MIETLLQWDTAIFHWINHDWTCQILDMVMPIARNKYTWVPLYIFCVAWIAFNYSLKQTLWVYVFVAIGIFASDTISSKLIKYEFKRPRPCQEQLMDPPVIMRVSCGGGFSFTSSHATNHFCLAAFLTTVFGGIMRRWKYLWWVWALFISIAQVYVGLHYPLDILGGGLLGTVIGLAMGILCRHLIRNTEAPGMTEMA